MLIPQPVQECVDRIPERRDRAWAGTRHRIPPRADTTWPRPVRADPVPEHPAGRGIQLPEVLHVGDQRLRGAVRLHQRDALRAVCE